MIRILNWVISRLPSRWIRTVGHWQFQIPLFGPLIGWIGRRVLAGRGTIHHGIGRGLRFDASGGSAGFLYGTAEPAEQSALASFLKPGDVFFDIGANVGFFAVLAARLVGPNGRVYAFDPSPKCIAAIRNNFQMNRFSHGEAIEAAVSSSAGRSRLQFGAISGQSTIVRQHDSNSIEVDVISIDDFIRERKLPAPSLVMIDAEGAEVEILKGMRETIAECRPVMMCEVHWIGDEFLAYCREQLEPLGYATRPLVGDEFPSGPQRFHAVLLPPGQHENGAGAGVFMD